GEAPLARAGQRFLGQRAAVEKGHDAEIAAELLQADARLEAEFGKTAAAHRIAVHVLGSELLIAVAAHRPAAARIEAPRRRKLEVARADDRAEPDSSGDDNAIRHAAIGARGDLR